MITRSLRNALPPPRQTAELPARDVPDRFTSRSCLYPHISPCLHEASFATICKRMPTCNPCRRMGFMSSSICQSHLLKACSNATGTLACGALPSRPHSRASSSQLPAQAHLCPLSTRGPSRPTAAEMLTASMARRLQVPGGRSVANMRP
jgi:hypothetical protein